MSLESTRATIMRYLNAEHSDVSMLADDVVFTIMATGQEHHTPQGVLGMMDFFYHQAFDAKAVTRTLIFTDKQAVLEADFVGVHTGEFAGVPASGKTVSVPFCVVYDLENDQIKRARVYFEIPALMPQIATPAVATA